MLPLTQRPRVGGLAPRPVGVAALFALSLSACAGGGSAPVLDPTTPSDTLDPRPFHGWLAGFHSALVLDCALPGVQPGASLDTELAGPTSVVDGHLVRVVPNPTGIGLLDEGGERIFLRWEIAQSGQACTREAVPTAAPTTTVRGRVLGPGRVPAVGARVTGCGLDTQTDASGTFHGELDATPGTWWGLDHAWCVLEARGSDGSIGRRSVALDEPHPESLRVQLTPTDPLADRPAPPAPAAPTPSDVPASLGDVPAAWVLAATDARAAAPAALLETIVREPRGSTPSAYLLDDLKAAMKPGRTWVFRLFNEGPGERELRWSVSHVDAAGVHIFAQEFPADGSDPTEPNEQVWRDQDLLRDSRFARELTTVEPGTWDVAGVQTPVWIYRTRSEATGEPAQDRVFARDEPGPAVHATFYDPPRQPGTLDRLRVEDRPPTSIVPSHAD